MRKLFFLIAILLLMAGTSFAGDEILGQGGYPSDAHKIFRFVHNATATVLTQDSIVIWDLTEDDGVSVTTTVISDDSAVAGILAEAIPAQGSASNTAAQDIGRPNWGLMQTYGKAQVDVTTYVSDAGAAMGTGTTAGEASQFTANTIHSYLNGKAGFFYDTAGIGETDVECFLVID